MTSYFEGGWVQCVPVYQLINLGADDKIIGPAVIIDQSSTIIIEPGWIQFGTLKRVVWYFEEVGMIF